MRVEKAKESGWMWKSKEIGDGNPFSTMAKRLVAHII